MNKQNVKFEPHLRGIKINLNTFLFHFFSNYFIALENLSQFVASSLFYGSYDFKSAINKRPGLNHRFAKWSGYSGVDPELSILYYQYYKSN